MSLLVKEYMYILLGLQKTARPLHEIIPTPLQSEVEHQLDPVDQPPAPIDQPIPSAQPTNAISVSDVLQTRAMKYQSLANALRKLGFLKARTGKHDIFQHPEIKGSIPVLTMGKTQK